MSAEGILASTRQAGNPILPSIRRVKVELSSAPELDAFDFIVNSQLRLPILFLSLKFHSSFKDYITSRISHVVSLPSTGGQSPVLLVLVDVEDAGAVESYLEEVTVACVLNGVRLLLAWTPDEAAKIIEILHVFGPDRAGDIARGAISTASSGTDQLTAQAKEAVVTVQGGVGPKDAATLLSQFGSIKNLVMAGKESLTDCPSIGVKKSTHLFNVFNAAW